MSSLADLRTAVRRYINETDTTNTNFQNPELNDYLNQATLFLGTQMEWQVQTEIATAIPNQALYQLPNDFIEILDVYFNQINMPVLDRADIGRISSTWQQDPVGTPKVCYKFDQQTLGLYNVPDSNQTGYQLQIQYIALPQTLVNDTDIPELQSAYQMCLPFYAAFLCEHRMGNDKKADANLQRFDQHRKALMARVQKFSDDLLRFRWAWTYPERNT